MSDQKKTNTSQTSTKPTTSKQRRNKARYFAKKRKKHNAKKAQKQRSPQKQYISVCCSAPARKPRAGEKYTAIDPETRKVKEMTRGLGKWRCTACNKVTKVRAQALPTETPVAAPPTEPTVG